MSDNERLQSNQLNHVQNSSTEHNPLFQNEEELPQTGWFRYIPLENGRVVMPFGLEVATGTVTHRQPLWLEPDPELLENTKSREWMLRNTGLPVDEITSVQREIMRKHRTVQLAEDYLAGQKLKRKGDRAVLESLKEEERRYLGHMLIGSRLTSPMQGEVGWVERKSHITKQDLLERHRLEAELRLTSPFIQKISEILQQEGIDRESDLSEQGKEEVNRLHAQYGESLLTALTYFEQQRIDFLGFMERTYKVSGIRPIFRINSNDLPELFFEEVRGIAYQYYKDKWLNDPNNPELAYRYAFPLAACIGYVTADENPLFLLQWRAGAGEQMEEIVTKLENLIREGNTEELEKQKINIQAELEKLAVNKIYGDVLGPPGGIMDAKRNPEKHGLIEELTTESARKHAEWELDWEVGISPEQTAELIITSAFIDEREFHSELGFYGKSTLTFQEIVDNAIRIKSRINPNYAHEFAERTTGIPADPEVIRQIITTVNSPLPTTHVACLEVLGHRLLVEKLLAQDIPFDEALQKADAWLFEVDILALRHYVAMDKQVTQYYAENPERLQALQILFPDMNPDGYDPHIPATLQGFKKPLDALREVTIQFQNPFLAAEENQENN